MNKHIPLPLKVEVLNIDIDVLCGEDSDEYLNEDEFGLTRTMNKDMVIRDGLPYAMESDTILHEIVHWELALTGMSLVFGDTMEEQVVSAVTSITLDTLRRNPQLREYLFRED